jgi:hypothetical protein
MPLPTFFAELRERLAAPLAAREVILDLVRWLDAREPQEASSLEAQALARALVACGSALEHLPTVVRTLAAAREYVANPTDEQWDALVTAATASYPFGPGDGCFAIRELGFPGCEPGSGCRSGAGTLACVAEEIGYETAAAAIRGALGDWIQQQGANGPEGGTPRAAT